MGDGFVFFFFKQKTAYEMRISDWSSDVCSSDLPLARAMSPVFHLPECGCPLLLAWGEHETAEFKRQSQLYAAAWQAQEYPARVLEVPGVNHFNILMDLQDSHSALSCSILELMGL